MVGFLVVLGMVLLGACVLAVGLTSFGFAIPLIDSVHRQVVVGGVGLVVLVVALIINLATAEPGATLSLWAAATT